MLSQDSIGWAHVVEAKGLKDNVWPKNWPKDATSTIYLELVQQTWVGGGRSGIDRQIFSQNNSETDVFVSVKQISLATWVVLSQFLLKLVQILIRIQLPDIWLGQRYKCYTQSLSDFGRNSLLKSRNLYPVKSSTGHCTIHSEDVKFICQVYISCPNLKYFNFVLDV